MIISFFLLNLAFYPVCRELGIKFKHKQMFWNIYYQNMNRYWEEITPDETPDMTYIQGKEKRFLKANVFQIFHWE